MKYLVGLLVVLVVAWRWRTTREAQQVTRQRATSTAQPQVVMAVCGHCGVHLPAPDAIKGARGPYCSNAHRQLTEP